MPCLHIHGKATETGPDRLQKFTEVDGRTAGKGPLPKVVLESRVRYSSSSEITVSSSRNCRSLHCLSKFAVSFDLTCGPEVRCCAQRSVRAMALSDGGSGSRREEARVLAQVDAFEQTAAKTSKKEAKSREADVNRQVPEPQKVR